MHKTSTEKAEFSNDLNYSCASPVVCQNIGIPDDELLSAKPGRKHFLKFFLDTSYYLCVIPYKIVNVGDGTFRKKTCILQQILCAAVHFAAVMDLFSDIRSVPFHQIANTPRMYFDIFMITLHGCVIISFCYSVWRKWDHFCWLVKILEFCPIISLWYPKKINWFMMMMTVVYVVMAILNPLYNEGYGVTWEAWFNFHISRGRYLLFFSSESTSKRWGFLKNSTAVQIVPTSSGIEAFLHFPQNVFIVASYFADLSQWIVIYHVDLFVNVMALTLWCATTFFINTLKCQPGCTQALISYEALKKLTNHINGVAGTIVLTYMADSILFYATHLESLFTGEQWFSKLVVIQFLLSAVAWLHFASASCLKMDKFREWVRTKENASSLPSKSISIMLLLDEISTHTVGLSGNGLFTVNYTFVAQAVTTVMTYFILVIQFK